MVKEELLEDRISGEILTRMNVLFFSEKVHLFGLSFFSLVFYPLSKKVKEGKGKPYSVLMN